MTTSTVEVFVATYDTEDGAAAASKGFQAAQRDGAIDLIDAAVIVHTADGKVKIEETADPSGKKWAKRGAIAGGVVGLIFPPSIIVSAAVGGGAGGDLGQGPRQGLQGRGSEADRQQPAARLVGHHRGRRGQDGRAAGARAHRLREDREARGLRRGRRRHRGRGGRLRVDIRGRVRLLSRCKGALGAAEA